MRYRLRTLTRMSLSSLFALITAICCFLAYEANWIRQRRDARLHLGTFHENGNAPLFLRLLGERGVERLVLEVSKDQTHEISKGSGLAIESSHPQLRATMRLFSESEKISVGIPIVRPNRSKIWR